MKVRFTSIVWEEVGDIANGAVMSLQNRVALAIGTRQYGAGLDELLGVLVSVDAEENARFAKPYNKLSTIKSAEGVKVRQLCLAVEIDPNQLTGRTETEVASLFANGLSERLRTAPTRLPKAFDWSSFSMELTLALAADYAG